jgi:hypothetical protein
LIQCSVTPAFMLSYTLLTWCAAYNHGSCWAGAGGDPIQQQTTGPAESAFPALTPHIDQHNTRPRLHDCLGTTVAAPRTFLDAFTDSLRREKRMYCIQTSAAWSEGRSAMGPPAGARAGSSAPGLAARASWACRRARGLTSSCLTMSSYTWGEAQHSTARYVTTPARHVQHSSPQHAADRQQWM